MRKTRINKKKRGFRNKTRKSIKKMGGENDDEMKLIYTKRGFRSNGQGDFTCNVYLNSKGHIKIISTHAKINFGAEFTSYEDNTSRNISKKDIDFYIQLMDKIHNEGYADVNDMVKELQIITLFKNFPSDNNVSCNSYKQYEHSIKGLNQEGIRRLTQGPSNKEYEHAIRGLNQRIINLTQDNSALRDENDTLKSSNNSSNDILLPSYDKPNENEIKSLQRNSG